MVTTGVDSPPGDGPGSPDEPPPGSRHRPPRIRRRRIRRPSTGRSELTGRRAAGGGAASSTPILAVAGRPHRARGRPRGLPRVGVLRLPARHQPGRAAVRQPDPFAVRNEPDIRVPAPGRGRAGQRRRAEGAGALSPAGRRPAVEGPLRPRRRHRVGRHRSGDRTARRPPVISPVASVRVVPAERPPACRPTRGTSRSCRSTTSAPAA